MQSDGCGTTIAVLFRCPPCCGLGVFSWGPLRATSRIKATTNNAATTPNVIQITLRSCDLTETADRRLRLDVARSSSRRTSGDKSLDPTSRLMSLDVGKTSSGFAWGKLRMPEPDLLGLPPIGLARGSILPEPFFGT